MLIGRHEICTSLGLAAEAIHEGHCLYLEKVSITFNEYAPLEADRDQVGLVVPSEIGGATAVDGCMRRLGRSN